MVVGGEVRPSYSPGHLAVNGSFSMESGSLIMEIKGGGAGQFDVISTQAIALSGGTIQSKPGRTGHRRISKWLRLQR